MALPTVPGPRRARAVLGGVLFVLGAYVLWDATERRGRKLPWPLGAGLPW